MSSDLTVGVLFYVAPLLLLVVICMCCAVVRESRRGRANNINQRIVPIQIAVVNSVEQCSGEDNHPPPPPYTAEPFTNFDESLPSYERAINRPL